MSTQKAREKRIYVSESTAELVDRVGDVALGTADGVPRGAIVRMACQSVLDDESGDRR